MPTVIKGTANRKDNEYINIKIKTRFFNIELVTLKLHIEL